MAEVRIVGKTTALIAGHLYLIFVDDPGQESMIRGGPANKIHLLLQIL